MKILFAIFLINFFFLYSKEIVYKEINYKSFLIKYSSKSKILINKKILNKNEYLTICGNKRSNFNLLVYLPYINNNNEEIINIYSDSNFYLELYYDENKKEFILKNILGDFNINISNSNCIIQIDKITIKSNNSSYDLISYSSNLLYLYLNSGKIEFINNKKSNIIIAGESITFINKYIYISKFSDILTAKNVLINNLYTSFNNYKENKNFIIEKKFIESIINNKNFIDDL